MEKVDHEAASYSALIMHQFRAQNASSAIFDVAADTMLRIDSFAGPVVHLVLDGEARLEVDARKSAVLLKAGDSVVLIHGDGHRIAHGSGEGPIIGFGEEKCKNHEAPPHVRIGGGPPGLRLFTSFLDIGYQPRAPLAHRSLPAAIILSREAPPHDHRLKSLSFDADQINEECRGQGGMGFAAALAHLHFTHVMRSIYRRNWGERSIAIMAPNTRRMIGVIRAVRAQPEYPWTVVSLARHAGLSRSAFADSFETYAGMPPMSFVTRTRMERAAELLGLGSIPTHEIAQRVGYQFEGSFARAFKRFFGFSPRQFVQNKKEHRQSS
jgi:AraC-like DNA-binding protein